MGGGVGVWGGEWVFGGGGVVCCEGGEWVL